MNATWSHHDGGLLSPAPRRSSTPVVAFSGWTQPLTPARVPRAAGSQRPRPAGALRPIPAETEKQGGIRRCFCPSERSSAVHDRRLACLLSDNSPPAACLRTREDGPPNHLAMHALPVFVPVVTATAQHVQTGSVERPEESVDFRTPALPVRDLPDGRVLGPVLHRTGSEGGSHESPRPCHRKGDRLRYPVSLCRDDWLRRGQNDLQGADPG